MKTTIALTAVFALVLSAAQAEGRKGGFRPGKGHPGGHHRPNPEEIIKRLDTDGDGTLSLDEFKAGKLAQENPERAEAHFKKVDADSNGFVTPDELKTAWKERHKCKEKGA